MPKILNIVTAILDTTRTLMLNNIDVVIVYNFSVTAIIITMLFIRRNKKTKYRVWKRDNINLIGLFKREWESTPDSVLQELWDENQLLEKEVALFKKKYRGACTSHFLMSSIIILLIYLRFTNFSGWKLILSILIKLLFIGVIVLLYVAIFTRC